MIYSDVIPLSLQDDIEKTIGSPNFPWFYNEATNYSVKGSSGVQSLPTADNALVPEGMECPQFTHVMRLNNNPTSEFNNLVYPLVYFMEQHIGRPLSVYRIKANLLYKNPTFPEGFFNPPHTDFTEKGFKSVVYYVDDSDGDTVLFKESFTGDLLRQVTVDKRVTPKKGSFFVFDSERFHSSTPPRINDRRMVINFILRYE